MIKLELFVLIMGLGKVIFFMVLIDSLKFEFVLVLSLIFVKLMDGIVIF